MTSARFDVVLHRSNNSEAPIASFTHVFARDGAQQYDDAAVAAAVASAAGDTIVLRVTVAGPADAVYVPNGDSPPTATARWLTLDLPP